MQATKPAGLIQEVQTADYLGYSSFDDFRRDLRKGLIPAPSKFVGGKRTRPAWSIKALEQWLDDQDLSNPSSDDLINRVSKHA